MTSWVQDRPAPRREQAPPSLQREVPAHAPDRANLYEDPDFRRVAGPTLRPGGLGLTARGLTVCSLPQGALVLDIGCGTGASAAFARGLGFLAVGVDSSEVLLREAQGKHPGAALAQGGAEQLPVRSEACDAVLCECVLSLTMEPDRAVAEFRRVLRPDGYLILTDIYLREAGHFTPVGAKSCLDGAESREGVTGRLARHGFDILRFEDHSRLLADLAARLAFADISPARFFGGSGRSCGNGPGPRARFGYYLLVASRANLLQGEPR